MSKKIFSYNVESFRKKLIIRTSLVLSMFLLFLIYNTFQLPGSERGKFLMIFTPLFFLLVWFMKKNFSKQVDILKNGRVEIEGGMLKQFDSGGSCASIRLKDIEKITQDKFRSYDRLVIETKEKIYPIVNIKDFTGFKETVESSANVKAELDETEISFFTIRTALFFVPSLVFVIALYIPNLPIRFPFLNKETGMLFFNINLIVFFLYMPEKKNYILPGFSLKRRMLFISLMVFFFQVYTALSKAGFFVSEPKI
ncbi:hypothetical protein [Leptospira ilyithenensis]|uniref:Uncharacterized protein n=1 Tax=Leptospira ilyithenensis TaxID=2484901 RepID=A0A4V3JXE2_9LEPT|nr:hypothetical protein [Leptospira ilyithenensis]TGN14378.1 hypothetical protein EHS11_01705 [Leptospira ilyithenensis]